MEKLPLIARGPEIFDIWKKTLLFWLSRPQNVIYLVTPFLDEDILGEFLDIVKTKKETANLGHFFVRETCHEIWVNNYGKQKKNFTEVWNNITLNFNEEDKKFFNDVVLPRFTEIKRETNYIHAKFIGCENMETDEAEVLLTSANFNATHFREYRYGNCNHDSVGYHMISKEKFRKGLISPIINLLTPNQ